MKHVELEYLKKLLERKYGDLNNERGCYVDGQWFSLKAVVELIDRADEKC